MRGSAALRAWCGRVATGFAVLAIAATVLVVDTPLAGGSSTEWTSMYTPFLKPGANALLSVSCPAGTVKFCVAVGYTSPSPKYCNQFRAGCTYGPAVPLLEVWRGSWKVTAAPFPGSGGSAPDVIFSNVSCASTTFCMVLGSTGTGDPNQAPQPPHFADVWNGTSWSLLPTSPAGDPATVSCFSSECLAVGNGSTADLWDGQSWTSINPSVGLVSDSCGSAAQCLAVGGNSNLQGQGTLDGEFFDGGAWTDEPPPPPPAGAVFPRFNFVGCAPTPAPISCMATGWSGAQVADLWNESTGAWTVTTPVTPTIPKGDTGGGWGLGSVACPASNECIDLGYQTLYGTVAGFGFTLQTTQLAQMWNGSAWTSMKVAGATTSGTTGGLESISCPTTTFCVAVGYRTPYVGSNNLAVTAESWGTPPAG